jgi:ATP-dependent DNA ligase
MRLAELVAVSKAVADTSGRLEKIGHLAELLKRVPPAEIPIVIPFLSGSARQGRVGIGFAALGEARDVPAASEPSLDVSDVDAAFERIAALSGSGSASARIQTIRDLLRLATHDEQDFLVRLMFGELRQGALEGVLVEAVARPCSPAISRRSRAARLPKGTPRWTSSSSNPSSPSNRCWPIPPPT